MKRFMVTLTAALALAGCGDPGGNPLAGGDGTATPDPDTGGTDTTGIPESLSKNLTSISEPDGNTVLVNIASLDSTPLEVTFNRRPALDTAGYLAYSIQEDPLDRLFIALTRTSADGSSRAAVVQDGGQFNRYLDGGFYEQIGTYTDPAVGEGPGNGQVSYAGTYAGFTNIMSTAGAGLQAIPGTVDPNTLPDLPGEAFRFSALIFLNANFAERVVNGGIYNRDLIDPSDLSVQSRQPNIQLIITDIAADGSFNGDAEIDGEVGIDSGDYGGVFGGIGAASVSGVVALDNFNTNIEDELEIGVFVLTQCGQSNDADLCDIVLPD